MKQAIFLTLVLGGIALLGGGKGALAEPFLPPRDEQIIERLPAVVNATLSGLAPWRERLQAAPQDPVAATELARRYVELGRAEADPRYYGYAEAALQPWWDLPQPPPAVWILRATLRQARHQFELALQDLEGLLRLESRNAQAWLTRAVILQVRGEYAEARRSCARLLRLAEPLVVAACTGSVLGLQGQGEAASQLLQQALQGSPQANVQLRLWALTVLAELAARRADDRAAERHFREAFALGVRDSYLLGAYADWLLDRGRDEEVRRLLRDETRTDGLLLRLALAERRLGAAGYGGHVADLQARFDASRRRGDDLHLREWARVNLELLDRAEAALALAQRNWAVQREPWDARLVLEAALAAGKPEAAGPVLEWLAQTGLEDVYLAQLSGRLKGI